MTGDQGWMELATAWPLGGQQLRDELGQLPGDVERGTTGDHVGPSVEVDLRRDLFYWGSTPVPGQPGSSACLPGHPRVGP